MQLWNLWLIRQELKELNLDWDMPSISAADPTTEATPVTVELESDSASQAEPTASGVINNPSDK